eukprot:331007_1
MIALASVRTIEVSRSLLLGLSLILVTADVVVLQGVPGLAGGKDAQPVTELLLLQELLGEVLEVALLVGHGGANGEDVLVHVDLDLVGQLALAAVELDVLLEVLLEGTQKGLVEDTVSGGDGAVDLEDLLALVEGLGLHEAT